MYDIQKALVALDIDIISMGNDEIRGHCPMHEEKGGKKGSPGDWNINAETGLHNCWSCGYSGSIVGLVCEMLDLSAVDARKWLVAEEVTSVSIEDLVPRKVKTARKIEERKNREIFEVITEAHLFMFDPVPVHKLDERNLDPDIADDYEILWNESQGGSWIIPIRDTRGHLHGYQEKYRSATVNRPPNMETRQVLFGLNQHDPECDTLVVVESPLDVVRLATAGVGCGVATFGASVTPDQMDLLSGHCKRLIIAMDNDAAGRSAHQKLQEHLGSKVRTYVWSYKGTTGKGLGGRAKDPGDMTDDEIMNAFENCESSLARRIAKSFR